MITLPDENRVVRDASLIGDEAYHIAFDYVLWIIRLIISSLGITTNSLSIRTFYKIGVNDNVTMVLVFQCVLDLCSVTIAFFNPIAAFVSLFERKNGLWFSQFPADFLLFLFAISSRLFSEASCMVTTFLALQRCLCVAMPLHFKRLFTRGRTIFILIFIVVFNCSLYVTLLFYQDLQEIVIQPMNLTRKVLYFRDGIDAIRDVIHITFFQFFNTANQVIVTFCVIYMARTLNKSVKFRSGTKTKSASAMPSVKKQSYIPKEQKLNSSHNTGTAPPVSDNILSDTKELLIIRQITFISIIFLVCNVPRFVLAFSLVIEPEMNWGRQYEKLYLVVYSAAIAFDLANSSLNFFAYYKYNPTFRKTFFNRK